MKTKTESHLSPLFPISLLALVPSLVFGAGLAAIKEQTFHQDAGANIVVYSTLRESAQFVIIETANRTFTIEPKKLAGRIEVLAAIPTNITTDTELEPVRKVAEEYREFTSRFPKAAPILANHIAMLDACIKDFEGGKARFNGVWMTKEEALAAAKKEEQSRNEEEAALKQKHEEKLAFEKAQAAKGLVKYDGKWITKEEALRSEAQVRESLKQQAIAEEKRRRAEEQYEEDGLVLLKKTVKGITDDWSTTITGTVVNCTGKELKMATIEYKIYDASDAQIGSARATITDLEADGRWNFKACGLYRGSYFKIAKLSGF